MRCVPAAPPATLPPLDREGNDDETLGDEELGGLIAPLDDLPDADDDEGLTDPDFGIEPPSDPFATEHDTSIDIDIGADYGLDTSESGDNPDDASGLETPLASGLDDAEDELPPDGEDRDGIDEGKGPLDDVELPDLDADDGPGEGADSRFGELVTADESELSRAERPFRVSYLSHERERCTALTAIDGIVVAGSSDLLWLDRGRAAAVRIALEGTRITSLALVGRDRSTALCVTSFGKLLRRTRLGSDSERLPEWRRASEAPSSEPETIELRQLGAEEPRSVLGRLASGQLIKSDDEGLSFRPLDSGLAVRALSPSGAPLAGLLRDAPVLCISFDGGQSWERRELPSPAREIAGGEAPLLGASGPTLVVADAERGLAVSSDGGKTFSPIRGAAGVTACTAGTLAGRATVWAALYREASDATDLVQVDVTNGSALIVARVETSDEADPDRVFEAARLERLVWDGERLFAVGGAGLLAFQPDPN